MSGRVNPLLIGVIVSILFSGVNTYLILSNQSSQDRFNSATSGALSDLQGKAAKASSDLVELRALQSATDGSLTDLKNSYEKTSIDFNALRADYLSSLDREPARVYEDSYRSVVLVRTAAGLGSGFVYDSDNRIVTSWHVVEYPAGLEVEFHDGSRSSATILGTNPYSDLAVLLPTRAPAGLKPISLADSDTCEVGEPVVAIGNPQGIVGSLSSGYVSRKDVQITVSGVPLVINEMQLELTIATGSSGGVVLNLDGEALGVMNALSGPFGCAVPSNIVKRVADSIIARGSYEHPLFGYSILALDGGSITDINVFNVEATQRGLMVTEVQAGTPAQAAGLQAAIQRTDPSGRMGYEAKDIVVAINGVAVDTFEQYKHQAEETLTPGVEVDLTVWRSGTIIHVKITPTARAQYARRGPKR